MLTGKPLGRSFLAVFQPRVFLQPPRRQHFKSFQSIYSDCTENSCVISPRSCRGFLQLRRVQCVWSSTSRRVFGLRDFAEISPRFWPPRCSSRRDLATNPGAYLAPEISPVISARFWPPRFSSRRDLASNLGAFLAAEIFISPRSRH